MKKIILILLVLSTSIFATSYNFQETRYSEALEKSFHLDGVISFSDGLTIKYNNSDKSLVYEDEELEIFKDGESIELDENEALKVAQYFEIILMLYHADEKKISNEFSLVKSKDKTTLTPLSDLKNHMFKIELKRENSMLKKIKMFLSNSDKITISILDEIR